MHRLQEIVPEYVDGVPEVLQEGILYISKKYGIAMHNCACGCGQKTATPLGDGEWTLTEENAVVSLHPSIGNFSGENPYHAHYFILNNKIEWV